MTWALLAFALSLVATVAVKKIASRWGIMDRPTDPRKVHAKPTPLLGGVAIFLSFAIVVLALLSGSDALTSGEITPTHYLGVLAGGLILMIGGFLDDKYNLPPRLSFIAPVLAALVAIGAGIEVSKLTNPFGGILYLEAWQSNVLVFAWLLVVMFTTKFLDGLDGLATGVSAIASLMIMLLAMTTAYLQPDVALLSSVALGSLLGFLPWNFHPAKIFLGEGGSTFVGYLVGILAVISGGKVATALLVLGIPLLDVVWVILRRLRSGGVAAIAKGDRKHLHHRLLDLGWSQRKIVLAYYVVAASFGFAALFLQSQQKLVALGLLIVFMLVTAAILVRREYATAHRVS
jgi:UDP-GlcNAc:undecaprenyl-phosphate GlcNAc-1-phosphate transferase